MQDFYVIITLGVSAESRMEIPDVLSEVIKEIEKFPYNWEVKNR